MKKLFYSHLIEIESVIIELDKLDLSKEQKIHLASLMDSSLHHTILDAILSELSSDDKIVFLYHYQEGSHDKIWHFLNSKIEDVEKKIKKAADGLKAELHKDLKKAKGEIKA
ncbi:MAG: hypothetical protein Q7R43_00285 [Candidatus Daviesbacteria bacterium]|nr:hypothetical protein [Candidatus Daviesbacteria bacterium]